MKKRELKTRCPLSPLIPLLPLITKHSTQGRIGPLFLLKLIWLQFSVHSRADFLPYPSQFKTDSREWSEEVAVWSRFMKILMKFQDRKAVSSSPIHTKHHHSIILHDETNGFDLIGLQKTTIIFNLHLIFFCKALSIISTRAAPRFLLQCFLRAAKSCNKKVLIRALKGVKGSGNL